MSVRHTTFRWCMLVGAAALLGVCLYYAFKYYGLNIAVTNAGLTDYYQKMIRAMWVGYCAQAGLLGVLFIVAAVRPHWISRPLIVICGLVPLAEAVLGFSATGSFTLMMVLTAAAVFVLIGAVLWPPMPQVATDPAAPAASVTSATVPPP
jgi:hypothetical protein